MALTKSQRSFLTAIYEDRQLIVGRRVVDALFNAGLVFPCTDNMFFWLVGCNGHAASEFVLTEAGFAALAPAAKRAA